MFAALERRCLHTFKHPQLFKQTIQLTDGSTVTITSVSDSRSFIKLGVDSLNHPSWNPLLRSKMLLSESGEVSRFKERFGEVENDAVNEFSEFFLSPKESLSTSKAKQ